ncbi:unnamed protein product, partial [marine sediment metagenome]
MAILQEEERTQSSLLRTANNQQLDSEEELQRKADKELNKPTINNLANFVDKSWDNAKNAKVENEAIMLQCARQRDGQYDQQDLSAIREQGGTEIFMMVTDIKCRAIEAGIKDVILPASDKPWAITPTEIPDMPEDINMIVQDQFNQELALLQQAYPQVDFAS